ncbi:HdeD family acid-resistance protein [Brachybacterium saurashtrense]|nr:DUF308 domain-containing protein [Brachybacterium saurashtrense]
MSDDVIGFAQKVNNQPRIPGAVSLWTLSLAYGVVTLGLGVTLVAWPRSSLVVIAVLVALQLLVAGVLRVVAAVLPIELHLVDRLLLAVTGALAVIVGLLCLREPLQTVLTLSIVLGAWWVLCGVVDVVRAVLTERGVERALSIIRALLTVGVGCLLVVIPKLSLGLMVLIVSLGMIVIGLLSILGAVQLRSARNSSETPGLRPPSPARAS